MTNLQWNSWSISTRLIWIAVVPVAVLFLTIVTFTWYARLDEVRSEVVERGNVIAAAVAESSEYALMTGNFSELERIAQGIIKTDHSIREISVINANGSVVFRMSSYAAPDTSIPTAKSKVIRQTPMVDDFSETGAPHITGTTKIERMRSEPVVIGHVHVSMSAVTVETVQKRRLALQTAIAMLAFIGSVIVASLLSRTLKRPLAAVIASVNSIRAGRYDVDVAVTNGGEIGNLQTSIREMSVSLYESKLDLERKVHERTVALEKSRNEAVKADKEKRKLIRQVNTAVEDERKSISIEIHDQLNATLIAAKLNSERILHLSQLEPSLESNSEMGARAQAIMNLTLELYEKARIIVRRLRPEVIDMLGLRGAIEDMILTYNASHPACHFEFRENGDCTRLESGLSITIFRLIQEGLSNIVKHSQATQAHISLKIDDHSKTVRLVILDNGVGCDVHNEVEGIGLIGMKERIHPFDGELQFDSEPGEGTKITVRLPLLIEGSPN